MNLEPVGHSLRIMGQPFRDRVREKLIDSYDGETLEFFILDGCKSSSSKNRFDGFQDVRKSIPTGIVQEKNTNLKDQQ